MTHTVDQITQLLNDALCVRLAYLFGSRVTGNVGPDSDYDIAVLLDADVEELAAIAEIAHELALSLATDKIDVIPLNLASIELAYAVIAHGKLLYQRDTATRVEYEAYVMGRYGDYLPILRAQRSELLEETDHATRIQRYRTAFERTERTLGEIAATTSQDSR
ncbi:MAG: nucleotidyltransferase domain-containing protein [Chloroflexi bacterium]|nr:nucleotidyltransferase domain-containing protein [Chloroflexota bacterium]